MWNNGFLVALFLMACSGGLNKPKSGMERPEASFVEIPGGNYVLGVAGHPTNPVHWTTLESFQISATEVTNAQWEKFIDATGYVTEAERYHNGKTFSPGLDEFKWVSDSTANWRFPFGADRGGIDDKMDHPVTNISYTDALRYCEWAGVRLPTIDEWEVASLAGEQGEWFWGDEFEKMNDYANIWQSKTHQQVTEKEDFLYTAPVAHYKPNAWGLYDMYGNVFEFCSDKPERYKNRDKLACSRGGSWWCARYVCNFFNSIDIGKVHKHASFPNQGFRVVKN